MIPKGSVDDARFLMFPQLPFSFMVNLRLLVTAGRYSEIKIGAPLNMWIVWNLLS
jgi:hypothetical protein